MGIVKPRKFRARLSSCGTDTSSVDYKRIENEDALEVALSVVKCMSDCFVGMYEKESEAQFRYDLGCAILDGINFDDDKLLEDLKKVNERFGKWKFAEGNK